MSFAVITTCDVALEEVFDLPYLLSNTKCYVLPKLMHSCGETCTMTNISCLLIKSDHKNTEIAKS